MTNGWCYKEVLDNGAGGFTRMGQHLRFPRSLRNKLLKQAMWLNEQGREYSSSHRQNQRAQTAKVLIHSRRARDQLVSTYICHKIVMFKILRDVFPIPGWQWNKSKWTSLANFPQLTTLLTETKWGLGCRPSPIGKFWRQSLVRQERGLHWNAAQSGRMANSPPETQRKTWLPSARPKPKAPSSVPSPVKVLSFGNRRWLLSQLLSSFNLLPQNPPVGQTLSPATWLPGDRRSCKCTGHYVHGVGKCIPFLPMGLY